MVVLSAATNARAQARHASTDPLVAAPVAELRPSLGRLLSGGGDQALRVGLDALALGIAYLLTPGHGLALLAFPLVTMLVLFARGLYRRRLRVVVLDGVIPVVAALSFGAMAALAIDAYVFGQVAERGAITQAWLAGLVLLGGARILLAAAQRFVRARRWTERRALIVGAGRVGSQVAQRLVADRAYGLRPVGFLDPRPFGVVEATGRSDLRVLGAPDDLERVARHTGADHVIIAFTSSDDEQLLPVVRTCNRLGIEVSLVPRLFEAVNHRATHERVGALPLLGLRATDTAGWRFTIKHAGDRVLAALLLAATAPLLALIALAIRLESPGPVLFRQRRIGRDGQAFDLLKFRSMSPPSAREKTANAALARRDGGMAPGGVEGADRRTWVGRFLRRSSLDELPQFINVLRGEMSLVGPRPERPEFVALFSEDVSRYTDRHRVRSGITGWAQVHGLRGSTSLADRVEHDNWYIQHWSLGLDIKILLLTVLAVLRPAE